MSELPAKRLKHEERNDDDGLPIRTLLINGLRKAVPPIIEMCEKHNFPMKRRGNSALKNYNPKTNPEFIGPDNWPIFERFNGKIAAASYVFALQTAWNDAIQTDEKTTREPYECGSMLNADGFWIAWREVFCSIPPELRKTLPLAHFVPPFLHPAAPQEEVICVD